MNKNDPQERGVSEMGCTELRTGIPILIYLRQTKFVSMGASSVLQLDIN